MNNIFKKSLRQLDCSENEIVTFLALLKSDAGSTILKLSQTLNIPRTTIYGHINTLEEKGLVKKGLGKSGAVYYAENLETIESLFNEKIKTVLEAKKSIEQLKIIQGINSTYNPKFILYDNKNAAELILKDILRSREEEVYWFWPLKEMMKVIPESTFSYFHEERIKRGIWLNMLWPEKRKVDIEKFSFLGSANGKESLRRIRVLPSKIDYVLGYGIYGNKVGFISSERENYGFIIDSKELATTFKNQFDYFWKISKKFI